MAEAKLDAITQSLVDQFVAGEDLMHLSPAEQFERFVNFAVISGEHSDTFNVEDVSGHSNSSGGISSLSLAINPAGGKS